MPDINILNLEKSTKEKKKLKYNKTLLNIGILPCNEQDYAIMESLIEALTMKMIVKVRKRCSKEHFTK